MSDLRGNIPSHIFYGCIMSELLRIARASLKYENLFPHASDLFKRMLNQGASKHQLIKQIDKAVLKQPDAFNNYSKTSIQIKN